MTPYFPGTILARAKGLFTHVGVVTERGTIFHNTPERGEHESSVEEFAAGMTVSARARVADFSSFLSRLNQRRFAPKRYDAFSNNCEHTLTALVGRERSSPQLVGWSVLIGIVTVAALFSR